MIVPFAGGRDDAREALAALARLELRAGDGLLVVDNTPHGALAAAGAAAITRIVHAPERRSSYYARNVGAELAETEWLLFVDADCCPAATLLDDYFGDPIAASCGAVGGAVRALAGASTLAARYSGARRYLDQAEFLGQRARPFAVTANLLVRRAAWSELGGFCEVRSGGDVDFCWRLQALGWGLALQERAVVAHRHRETLRSLVRQRLRYGAGAAWLERRYPGERPRARPARGFLRSVARAGAAALRGRIEAALFAALDAASFAAHAAGGLAGNGPGAGRAAPQPPVAVLLADGFPDAARPIGGDADALLEPGGRARVEARRRPERIDRAALLAARADYAEDEGPLRRLRDAAWLAARRPRPCWRDVRERSRPGERARPIRVLAPAVRRAARGGEATIRAAVSELEDEAERLRRLAGVAAEPFPAPRRRPR